MYVLEVRAHVDRAFSKPAKKDPGQIGAISEKTKEILEDPHVKPMRYPLAGMRRVRFISFVLLFSIDEQRKAVVLEDYAHHDLVYRRR